MASVSTKGGVLAKQETKTVANVSPLQQMLNNASVQSRFQKLLGDEADSFLSSMLTVVNDNKLLRNADPRTILGAAATAASLHMPIVPTLGKAYIVPYKGAASFQLGYKGAIELAQRSGKMKFITACPVMDGEIKNWDKFTETFERGEKVSDKVVGFYASFQLLNGFTKTTYWTVEEVIAHAKRFSKSYGSSSSPWTTDFEKMACKTVLLSILKAYSPMSIKMQQATIADGEVTVMGENGELETFEVVDVKDDETPEEIPDSVITEPIEVPFDA